MTIALKTTQSLQAMTGLSSENLAMFENPKSRRILDAIAMSPGEAKPAAGTTTASVGEQTWANAVIAQSSRLQRLHNTSNPRWRIG